MKIIRFVSILNHTFYAPLEALIETLTRLPSQKNLRRLLSRMTPLSDNQSQFSLQRNRRRNGSKSLIPLPTAPLQSLKLFSPLIFSH